MHFHTFTKCVCAFIFCVLSTANADSNSCLISCSAKCCFDFLFDCCDENYCCRTPNVQPTTGYDNETKIIVSASLLGLVLVGCLTVFCACLLCPCCTMYKRRHTKGIVYNQAPTEERGGFTTVNLTRDQEPLPASPVHGPQNTLPTSGGGQIQGQ